jgi:endonuclease YncB( thermonuclease family)
VAEWIWPDSAITRVIDGDTVDATVVRDIGFEGKVSFPVRLRLNRINAEPLKTAKGKLARARVLALTAGVRLQVVTSKGYKYGAPEGKAGEWMAEVVLPDGNNVSDVLVAERLATHWNGQGPRPDIIADPPAPASILAA